LTARLSRAGKHRVDRRAHEPPMTARRCEDLDLSGIGPATKRVRINAQDPARLPQREPVAALDRSRRLGDTANLGESAAGRRTPEQGHDLIDVPNLVSYGPPQLRESRREL